MINFSWCNKDLKNWIKNFEEENFSKSIEIFSEILEKNLENKDEKILFNLWNSLYKEKKFSEAEKIFKEIYEKEENSQKITSLEKSWKIEYQIWNTKYKIWEKIENPEKLSDERKMQRVFWKNFEVIIENYQESIANYKLWIKKNNLNKTSEDYENLNKLLTENLTFVENKLENLKKEEQEQNEKDWKQSSNWEKKSWEWNSQPEKPKENQLNKNDLEELENQLEKLNQEEIELKWGFDRFWKNNFKLENEPEKMDMQTLEEFKNSEENKWEEIFDNWEKDW